MGTRSRAHLAVVALLHTLVGGMPPALAQQRIDRSVRSLDSGISALVDAGVAHSPVFRQLVAALDRSDVVVYVACGWLPPQRSGQLTFVSAAGGRRYVLVRLRWDQAQRAKIATLGHELQHALEIAEHPEIVDATTMAKAFRRFGFEWMTQRGESFDSTAAVEVGQRVWKDVRGMSAAAAE